MSRVLVVILGCHEAIRDALASLIRTDERFVLMPALLTKNSPSNASQEETEIGQLLQTYLMEPELERDSHILSTVDAGQIPVVEQWHFGNVAYIATRSHSLAIKYREELSSFLASHPDLALRIFYVSTDLGALPETSDTLLQCRSELECVENLLRDYKLHLQTIDGDADAESIVMRIRYLLDNLGKV